MILIPTVSPIQVILKVLTTVEKTKTMRISRTRTAMSSHFKAKDRFRPREKIMPLPRYGSNPTNNQ